MRVNYSFTELCLPPLGISSQVVAAIDTILESNRQLKATT